MIELQKITKKYGDVTILEQADFTFPEKGLFCMLGPSGSGKTTILNLIAGFDTDYEGDIHVFNTSIKTLNKDELCEYRSDHIGFIFQNYHLLTGYTSLENIVLARETRFTDQIDNQEKALSILTSLSMKEKANQKVENLSGGQKQRVAIARSISQNPPIILADEPTGALDRRTTDDVMKLLKELAQEKLVIVITHDEKICNYADAVIEIVDKKIVCSKPMKQEQSSTQSFVHHKQVKVFPFRQAVRNFKVHKKRYAAISMIMAIGLTLFTLSFSSRNLTDQASEEFKEKNTVFNSGYIKGYQEDTFETLKQDKRIGSVYLQYIMYDITLSFEDKTEHMKEHMPLPKTTEAMSYGHMPQAGKNEIAISPSLAKKLARDIKTLIGKEMVVKVGSIEKKVLISGIYNAEYDDFFLSSDLEQTFYEKKSSDSAYSISYEVKEFADIVSVHEDLQKQGMDPISDVEEVKAFTSTFEQISRLFLIVSILVLSIGLLISTMLLMKLQTTRYHEMGLLSALGFKKSFIQSMLFYENLFLSSLASMFTLLFLLLINVLPVVIKISSIQMLFSILLTFVLVNVISRILSIQLVRMEPVKALQK